jgi:hypothetical protein
MVINPAAARATGTVTAHGPADPRSAADGHQVHLFAQPESWKPRGIELPHHGQGGHAHA